ncbi:tRNA (cytidine(34)-2'-O)-methyltransferase [Deinococcus peraridilitoris]|uniref:Putative tRNA (cytidine(34)-2'-O)-methyltransferase n=1 Tax=Deinococcus peraridilitoris (strain DSM 19664 / LMG 22246 / CIP 109416 / KR-200) TaxID=937777 RepID=K9ZZI9_DEIPD|nr:tRNA (cytidine(34)-2'-O)-methyltransferase [Deinococcus peraridilitoris]AFZ66594.1 putative rRNA methylase SpoU family [Deinococcus peraridilitoris DSM 19664]
MSENRSPQRPTAPLHVVLFEPENGGNVGNVARTCAVLGAQLHLIRPFGFRLHDPQFRRAGMDYLRSVELLEYASWTVFQASLPPGARLFGFSARTEQRYTDVHYQPGDYLVFGPESRGLPDWLREMLQLVTLPMPGAGRSLNLAVAAGIGAYEAMRHIEGW